MKSISIFTLFLLCLVNLVSAQNATLRTYYTIANKETKKPKEAYYYREVEILNNIYIPVQVIEKYVATDQLKLVGYFNNPEEKKFIGSKIQVYYNGNVKANEKYSFDGLLIDTAKYYYPNGNLNIVYNYLNKVENNKTIITDTLILLYRDSLGIAHLRNGQGYAELYTEGNTVDSIPKIVEKGSFKNHKRDGEWTGYFSNGTYHFIEQYENGKIIKGVSKDALNQEYPYDESNYMIAPQYPGGEIALRQFIANNYTYPREAIDQQLNGILVASFVVDTNGKLEDINVLSDFGYETGKELLNTLKKTRKWNPGIMRGIPIKAEYTLPMTLSISVQSISAH